MKIEEEIKIAMKSGEKERLTVLRTILSDAKNKAIAKRAEVSDEDVLSACTVLKAEAKEGITIYGNSGNPVAVENYNRNVLLLNVVCEFLPKEISEEELKQAISELVDVSNFTMKEFAHLMVGLNDKFGKGSFNGGTVQKLIKEVIVK